MVETWPLGVIWAADVEFHIFKFVKPPLVLEMNPTYTKWGKFKNEVMIWVNKG